MFYMVTKKEKNRLYTTNDIPDDIIDGILGDIKFILPKNKEEILGLQKNLVFSQGMLDERLRLNGNHLLYYCKYEDISNLVAQRAMEKGDSFTIDIDENDRDFHGTFEARRKVGEAIVRKAISNNSTVCTGFNEGRINGEPVLFIQSDTLEAAGLLNIDKNKNWVSRTSDRSDKSPC